MEKIEEFQGAFRWLSNFWKSPITLDGKKYATVEHFFQASKAGTNAEHEWVRLAISPGKAKYNGRHIKNLRDSWDDIKLSIMTRGVQAKFDQNAELAKKLVDTGDAILEEGNDWGDTYWGIDKKTGLGRNNLGIILMKVRETLIIKN
jgi:ribA/ribD-fused uncharacterized protein